MHAKTAVSLLSLLAIEAAASPAPKVFTSGAERVALVELYTSEGCDSCPPAEVWLSGLKSSADLWRRFVPVAFHVDYWDYLGWRDPLSSPAFSQREYKYVESWGQRSAYTPAVVVNGVAWGSWRGARQPPVLPTALPGQLTATYAGGKIVGHFVPAGAAARTYQLHAVLLGSSIASDVKGGENRGKRLTHDFAATVYGTVVMAKNNGGYSGEITLAPPSASAPEISLAVWVTNADSPTPIQATGGALP